MFNIYLEQLPSDIICTIHSQLDFLSQLKLKLTSILFATYPITNLSDRLPSRDKITDEILKLYPYATKLYANSDAITDLNYIIHLQKLQITHQCKITNEGIFLLKNLTELYIYNKMEIVDLNQLKNLQILTTRDSKIFNGGIKSLTNLTRLNIPNSKKIDNNYILLLTNLTDLGISNNKKITDINQLVNLQILVAEQKCGINNMGISALTNLTELYIEDNMHITNIDHMTKLSILRASGYSSGLIILGSNY